MDLKEETAGRAVVTLPEKRRDIRKGQAPAGILLANDPNRLPQVPVKRPLEFSEAELGGGGGVFQVRAEAKHRVAQRFDLPGGGGCARALAKLLEGEPEVALKRKQRLI